MNDFNTTDWNAFGRRAAKEGLTIAAQAVASASELLGLLSKELGAFGETIEKAKQDVAEEPKPEPTSEPKQEAKPEENPVS